MRRIIGVVVGVLLGCTGSDEPAVGNEFGAALTEVLASSDVTVKRRALERATEAARGRRIRSSDCVLVAGLAEDAVDYDEATADAAIRLYDSVQDCSAECREGLQPAYTGDWAAHSMLVRSAALATLLYRHPQRPRELAEAATKDEASFVRATAYQWLFAHVTGDDFVRLALEANADPSSNVREIAPVLAYPDAGVADEGEEEE